MHVKFNTIYKLSKEFWFQTVLTVVLLLFFSFDRRHYIFIPDEMPFFASYALAAFFINYHLLPLYFYTKKYILFAICIIITLTLIIVNEELILERIIYPTSRGQYFPGVFYTLIDILPILSIYIGFKFAWDAHKKQRELELLKNEMKESELQFLKSQINPHFLFNNLNNLYSYAIESSPKTPSIILELSAVLRYMLYECKEDQVSLSKELEHLESFTALNKLQIENRGTITFKTTYDSKHYTIAPLILIVFIENAFKHSTASQANNISIEIKTHIDSKGLLSFYCKNSFFEQTNTNSLAHGIGLENVKKRLRLLYPEAHKLEITHEENYYIVSLQLQLKPIAYA